MTENEKRSADWRLSWFRECREAGSWFLVFIVLVAGGWHYTEAMSRHQKEQIEIERDRLAVERERSSVDAARIAMIEGLSAAIFANNAAFELLSSKIIEAGDRGNRVTEQLASAIESDSQSRRDLATAIAKALTDRKE